MTPQPTFQWPEPMTERYRPRRISDFIGLEKPRKVLERYILRPYPAAWVFSGPPGTGKSTLALSVTEQLRAELQHIPSQRCNVEAIENACRRCWYMPLQGTFHVVLVDEADRMSNAAQLALLSKLDATAYPPATIFIFTCNSTEGLEPRFLSRCRVLEFSSYGIGDEAAELLCRVWDAETGGNLETGRPNFRRIVKESNNNVRDALMKLEIELLAAR